MARTFGAPTSVPAGNVAANRSKASLAGLQLAHHPADDVHHVAVALDGAARLDPDGAGHRDPAEVIARQVHQHHVLGILLRVREELDLTRQILLASGAARPGAGDGPQAACRPSSLTSASGEEPATDRPSSSRKYM
jgi:hypothetical protein